MKISAGNIPEEDIEYEKSLAEQEKIKLDAEQKAKIEMEKRLKIKKDLYKKKLDRERLEMLKERQGITEAAPTPEPIKVIYEKPKGKKAIENFWYHNRAYIILALIFFAIGGFLLYNFLSTEKADVNVMVLVSEGFDVHREDLEKMLEKYTDDVNGDGKVHVSVIYIPVDMASGLSSAEAANIAKLTAELQAGQTMLIISNEKSDEDLVPADVMLDLREDYPLNSHMTEYGFKLEGDKVKKALNWQDMPGGIYLGIKTPVKTIGASEKEVQNNYDKSRRLLDKLITDLS